MEGIDEVAMRLFSLKTEENKNIHHKEDKTTTTKLY